MRLISIIIFLLVLFSWSFSSAAAYHYQEVLGDTLEARDIDFPQITSGPGIILPDSPLYPLDKVYQYLRTILVFSAENKAKLHTQIAGERLAELRVATSRNNQYAIAIALNELVSESYQAARELLDAAAQGKNVDELAQEINSTLNRYREIVRNVAEQAGDTGYGKQLAAAADFLLEAKLIAGEVLPSESVEDEIAILFEEDLDQAVLGVSSSAAKLEKKLELYQKMASKAAEKKAQALKKREEALKKVKQQKEKIKTEQERRLQQQKARLEELKNQREAQLEMVRKTIKEAQEAAKKYRETLKEEKEAFKEATSD